MPVTVADALKMEAFSKCRLLTGKVGMDNEILWVNILEILDDLSHIEPGELLITTAHDFKTQSRSWQQGMIELFAARKLAAVAIQTGHYVEEIPQSFISFAEGHLIPLIEIPPDVSFKSITRALMNRLIQDTQSDSAYPGEQPLENRLDLQARTMKNLWNQIIESENPKDLHLELNRFNLEAQEPVIAAVIHFSGEADYDLELTGEDGNRLLGQAEPVVVRILRQFHVAFLLGPSDRYLTLLMQPGHFQNNPQIYILDLTQKLLGELKIYFPGTAMNAGLSCLHHDLGGLRPALGEAEKALQAANLQLVDQGEIVSYRNLGLYRLIMDIKNMETLKCYYEETIAPLLEYDHSCEGALIKTLQQYLESCSIKNAAEILYVHRHTMKYRLEQVRKITGLNPLIPEDALQLNIGLSIYRYLQSLNMLD
ncbi:MAG: PucR family transcriptional regulator ligand-binding domain-containing protein [Bacillota bacterium]|nr:PucR family transcriptional regulator ligand-binding domain-containing protein [Bacillota bacterium]